MEDDGVLFDATRGGKKKKKETLCFTLLFLEDNIITWNGTRSNCNVFSPKAIWSGGFDQSQGIILVVAFVSWPHSVQSSAFMSPALTSSHF